MFSSVGTARTKSDLSVGTLFRESPAKLLETLETTLAKESNSSSTPIYLQSSIDNGLPLFPKVVSKKDQNDFFGMMECEVFSNYMNLFLNLPLFPRFV